eukprot:m51a1_g9524 putative structure-specific endonuclease (257) ;mRNA; f:760853-761873
MFCCYLLTSLSPRHALQTYIGFTTDPRRRLRQHNGELAHGAKRTSTRRPWEMVVVVHGFETKELALQFEWAWQHPAVSRRARDTPAGQVSRKRGAWLLPAKLRCMYELLLLQPWADGQLGLLFLTDRLRVLCRHHKYLKDCPNLPEHMTATIGPVDQLPSLLHRGPGTPLCEEELDLSDEDEEGMLLEDDEDGLIDLTDGSNEAQQQQQRLRAHLDCLSGWLIGDTGAALPSAGPCPLCNTLIRWRDVLSRLHQAS